jgi:tungstate transport system ATP-binding protein
VTLQATHSALLHAFDLCVERGGHTVIEISELTVEPHRVLTLIGPNGAGKSTLLLTLAGLLKPHHGALVFRGQAIDSARARAAYRKHLAMVFQEPLLFNTSVFENVASGLKLRGKTGKIIRSTVEKNLEQFGISHLAHRSARTLSGGEAQRASLARAFAIEPEIIFLDEPFASLDAPTREALVDDLHAILCETKTTAIIATHDRMEALRLSDTMAVMFQGKIAQIGRPEDVMNHPADEQVASFVGTETILTGTVSKIYDGTFLLSIAGAELEAVGVVKAGEQAVCCIRPEHVTIHTNTPSAHSSARNFFTGIIVKIVPMGLFYKIYLDCGFPLVSFVTSQSLEHLELQEGKTVVASVKATAIHVIKK